MTVSMYLWGLGIYTLAGIMLCVVILWVDWYHGEDIKVDHLYDAPSVTMLWPFVLFFIVADAVAIWWSNRFTSSTREQVLIKGRTSAQVEQTSQKEQS